MTESSTRMILSGSRTGRNEIRELLGGLLASELIAPSEHLWLVSPWLRDVALLDNRAAAYRGIGPGWARRQIGLFDILAELTRRGSRLLVVTRPDDGNPRALDALRRTVGDGAAARRFSAETRPDLHTKGLVGDDYGLIGSMNFTRNGIEHLDEAISFTRDTAQVGSMRLAFEQEYGRLP